jgi:hypothetical protein
MALQGNLRDFSVPEILQLLASQKKTGCLTMEWNSERAVVFLQEGQIVSTRSPGLSREDSLLAFLLKVHRITEEQHKGLVAIQKESNRDAEELLQTGGYLNAIELAGFLDRMIIDDLMHLVRWESGSYRFDPNSRWPNAPLVKLGLEASLLEASRRVDEQKRFVSVFKDPHRQIAVHDLPDPNQPLTDAERDLFGIIDGQRTVEEIVRLAPLSEYEAYETLHRMLEAKWIEFGGRRDPGETAKATSREAKLRAGPPRPVLWELVMMAAVLGILFAVRQGGLQLATVPRPNPANDVFAAAQIRNLRAALELYRRENGAYPDGIEDMIAGHWITADQARVNGYVLLYRPSHGGGDCRIELTPDR